MRRLLHPNQRRLRAWLNGESDPSLDAHLATCQRCASALEGLDTPDDLAIGDALAAVLAPPDDLSDRLERKVAAQLDSKVMFGVVTDLFGAGIETSRLLLMEEPTTDE